MSKKRKRVPTALHSELSDYASLLRALRTTKTLDVVPHLTTTSFRASASNVADEPVDNERAVSEIPATDAATRSSESSPSIASHERGEEKGPAKPERDTWTRWPLLAGDVHVPEWSFEDEIRLLIEQARSLYADSPVPSSPEAPVLSVSDELSSRSVSRPSDRDVEPEDSLSLVALKAITDASSLRLEHSLSAIALHTPLVEDSMRNRLKPIGWENILDVVSASGLMDDKVIKNAQQRLEAIYGPASLPYSDRATAISSSKRRLANAVELHRTSFLSFPTGQPGNAPPKRKRGPYRKRRSGRRLEPDERDVESEDESSPDEPLAKKPNIIVDTSGNT